MIKRPEQVRLLAMGLPDKPTNRSDSNASSSSTQNNYNDRRNAVQGGAAISGDGNTMFTSIATTDQGAVQGGIAAALAGAGVAGDVAKAALGANGALSLGALNANGAIALGAINANGAVATNANNILGGIAYGANASAANANNILGGVAYGANANAADIARSSIAASSHLADVGLSMLQTTTALTNSLQGGVNQSMQAATGIASQLAQTQVAAANDNRYLIAAGMAVVAIVGVMAFSKGRA
ncbi:TPA: hypothetical protein QDB44_006429 [Burkholderia vietnamiensis]|nr:hypothetical protein [Burkholderia vietnamiensis]